MIVVWDTFLRKVVVFKFQIREKGKFQRFGVRAKWEEEFWKMVLRCGKEVKKRWTFLQILDNFVFCFLFFQTTRWLLMWRVGKSKVGTKNGINTKHTKTIIFFLLTVDSDIPNSWFRNHIFCTLPTQNTSFRKQIVFNIYTCEYIMFLVV